MAKISIDLISGKVDTNSTVIGIDLGTTNSLIATINQLNKEPYCISKEGDSIIPSAVHFSNEEILVGNQALLAMIDQPENTVYSVKRLMGKSYSDLQEHLDFFNYTLIDNGEDALVKIKINDKQYSPIELSSLVLKKLKQLAEEQLQEEINKVVITVPAYFNDAQRQATRDAGKLAGLDVLRIINEPTAASLAYGIGLNQSEVKTVAVYDLGGGTFDVSILTIQNGIFEVLSTNGDTFLGGDDFDRAIVKHWVSAHRLNNLNLSEKQQLRLLAEDAKKQLSSDDSYTGSININTQTIKLHLNLVQLNELIKPLIDRTIASCKLALSDANMNLEDIHEVVLVGGSVRNKAVKEAVSKFFSFSTINDTHNPDEVVALGAAVEADILAGNRRDILLLDVTPLSLGIETLGGLMDVILPRNSKIPNKVKRQYTTSVDGQINMTIGVYQGERDLVKDNRKLGEFVLKGIPAMPAGLPKIEVSFMLNADGILKVAAEEVRSGLKQEVTLKPQFGLTDEEIERMLKESIEKAEADMAQRSLLESVTEADQLIYSMNKFIRDNSELLTADALSNIEHFMSEIKNAIHAKNRDEIVRSCDALNEYSKQYAEQAMNKSISRALKGKKV